VKVRSPTPPEPDERDPAREDGTTGPVPPADGAGDAPDPGEEAAPETDAPEPERHVLFRAAGRRFALPLADVREVVVPPREFVRVPRAPAYVRGVMNLRGRVVPVVDLARLLGPGKVAVDPATTRILLLAGPIRDLGILVDGVTGIVPLADPAGRGQAGGPTFDGERVTCLAVDGIIAHIVSTLAVTR
jgi:purine-binding chemotaxis protein CheW